MKKLRRTGNLVTYLFICLALGAFGYFVYQAYNDIINLWIFASGSLLWLLGVANARITDLLCKGDSIKFA